MRILVTGGAGFIGSAYVRMLLGVSSAPAGVPAPVPEVGVDTLTVLDKLTYCGNLANLAPVCADERLRIVHGDICDTALVEDLTAGQDMIVHFAAESHVDRSIAAPAAFVATNVVGTQVLLDAALRHRVARFVQVSTDEVYGSITHGSWDETTALAPSSPYAASKASADLLALAYHRTHGLDVVITRCSNNYGPYQYPEKLIPLFVTNLFEGANVALYGDGANIRDWIHVDDHCAGIALAAAHGRAGQVYHIGAGTEMTNTELTGRLLAACQAGWQRVVSVADRKGHDRRYSLNTDKITTELGYAPRIPFDQGLAATVQWYRDNRAWWQPLKTSLPTSPQPA